MRRGPIAAAGCAAVLEGVLLGVLLLLGAEVGATLGTGAGAVVAVGVLAGLSFAGGCAATGYWIPDGTAACRNAATIAAAGVIATAAATGPWGLLPGMITASAAAGVARTTAIALTWDLTPRMQRPAALLAQRAATAVAAACAIGVVAVLVGPGGLSWRGGLLGLGVVALTLAATLAWLPRRAATSRELHAAEAWARLLQTQPVRHCFEALVPVGGVVVAAPALLLIVLEDSTPLGVGGRGAVLAATAAGYATLLAATVLSHRRTGVGDGLKPARTLAGLACAAMLASAATGPGDPAGIVFACAGIASAAAAGALLLVAALHHARAPLRTAAIGLTAGATALGGVPALAGVPLAHAEIGAAGALALIAAPLIGTAFLAGRAAASGKVAAQGDHSRVPAVRRRGLCCSGLAVRYGPDPVLAGIDLHVQPGSILAILGTNGAGKTTLLRAVAGLVPLERGRVTIDGVDVSDWAAERRPGVGLAAMLGEDGAFATLTVEESLALAARDSPAFDADRLLRQFPDLTRRRSTRVAALSGGERRQLALAQALVRSPRVLLADEPLAGLAPAAIQRVLAALMEAAAGGAAVVVVEQSLAHLDAVATGCIFLEAGVVRFAGGPAELARTPLLQPLPALGS